MKKKFDNIFLLARPAAGKSELIDFLKSFTDKERMEKFHIGPFKETDDFPYIWKAGEEDDLREKRGEERLHTAWTKEGITLTTQDLRGRLIGKVNDDVLSKYYTDGGKYYDASTLLIEFARGKGDGFKLSLSKFDKKILSRAAILYVKVSFEESYRRNNARYKEGQEASSLFHKVPDKDMYEFFIENDWDEISGGKEAGFITINGINVPFVSMSNEPELPPGPEIAKRYSNSLSKLFELYSK